ncbi:ABC transporter permease [Pararhizobium haloflavum]|uniref:ABC transporter permease n=1 Tax=Pararhizobium haloflavum TaxID=2037914 RepID=UPI000C174A9D|nr:ABC transporter permease [Pararhizobium haloflavum]
MGGPLLTMIVQRIALGVLLLFAVSLLIFAGTEILPGDVAQAILGQTATPEAIANIREQLGLDRPAPMRYLEWLGGAVQGDFGVSYSNRQEIATQIAGRLGNTLFLAAAAAAIAVPLAIILGILSVRYRNTFFDRIISIVTLTTISLPEFFSGYILMFVFAVSLQWFPSSATVYDSMTLLERLWAIALPVMTLVLVVVGHMMRMTRAAILNVLSSPYVETAELKGLSQSRIIWRHALPNAVAPIINVVALNLAYLVVGVVVIEVIFVYPGMGQYMVDHVSKRDVPVVQACGLIFASVYIILNTIADVASVLANPRLRHPR